MADLRNQIRDHYEARSLPPDKVAAILAMGRDAAGGAGKSKIRTFPQPARRTHWSLAIAASIAALAAIAGFWLYPRGDADYAQARGVVVAFFAAEHPPYAMLSPEPVKLREWALAKGAPAEFQIPAKLRQLPGKACTVLTVDGKPTYLLCFMTVDATGRMDGGMVHLLVARRGDFRNLPPSRTPSDAADGKWNFASWVEGDIVYTVAAPAPAEQVRSYVFAPTPGSTQPIAQLAVWRKN